MHRRHTLDKSTTSVSTHDYYFHLMATMGQTLLHSDHPPPSVVEEALRISGMGLYGVNVPPTIQLSMSKHWKEHKALIPPSDPALSFLHPLLHSWYMAPESPTDCRQIPRTEHHSWCKPRVSVTHLISSCTNGLLWKAMYGNCEIPQHFRFTPTHAVSPMSSRYYCQLLLLLLCRNSVPQVTGGYQWWP